MSKTACRICVVADAGRTVPGIRGRWNCQRAEARRSGRRRPSLRSSPARPTGRGVPPTLLGPAHADPHERHLFREPRAFPRRPPASGDPVLQVAAVGRPAGCWSGERNWWRRAGQVDPSTRRLAGREVRDHPSMPSSSSATGTGVLVAELMGLERRRSIPLPGGQQAAAVFATAHVRARFAPGVGELDSATACALTKRAGAKGSTRRPSPCRPARSGAVAADHAVARRLRTAPTRSCRDGRGAGDTAAVLAHRGDGDAAGGRCRAIVNGGAGKGGLGGGPARGPSCRHRPAEDRATRPARATGPPAPACSSRCASGDAAPGGLSGRRRRHGKGPPPGRSPRRIQGDSLLRLLRLSSGCHRQPSDRIPQPAFAWARVAWPGWLRNPRTSRAPETARTDSRRG